MGEGVKDFIEGNEGNKGWEGGGGIVSAPIRFEQTKESPEAQAIESEVSSILRRGFSG